MTICVAAICGNGHCIAVVTDRLKINDGNVLSGTNECKLRTLSRNSSMIYTGLSTHIQRTLDGLDELDGRSTLSVAQAVQMQYSNSLNEIVEERFIRPNLGVSYSEYLAMNSDVAMAVRQNYIQANDLSVRSVVLGVDDNGAKIIQATPDLKEGSAGFYAIGIGEELAVWTQKFLWMQEYDSNCSSVEGLFTACLAKTVAQEKGLAMGEESEMALQTQDGLVPIESPLKEAVEGMCRRRIDRLKIADSEREHLESTFETLSDSWTDGNS